jgi:hypothetical protein
MKRLRFCLLSTLALVGCTDATQPVDTAGLTETSMNLDQEHVEPFLSGISERFSAGFTPDEAAELADHVDRLWVGQTGHREFSVTFNGKSARLVVVAYKDDRDAPDLHFYSSADVAAQISQDVAAFFEAKGI